jgi:hypothetical protein
VDLCAIDTAEIVAMGVSWGAEANPTDSSTAKATRDKSWKYGMLTNFKGEVQSKVNFAVQTYHVNACASP